MKLNSLALRHYRNIEDSVLHFSDRLNIFIGDNGQGKTNFLESIHLLLEGESFRYGSYNTFIQFNQPRAVINSLIHNNDLDYKVQMILTSSKKEILINEKKTSKVHDFLPPIVLFSPESLSVIKESADERRQLIDQLISSVYKNGRDKILDFKKALKTRNKILKDISEEKTSREMGIQTLESLNQIYFKLAAEVTALRIRALTEIKPHIQDALQKIDSNAFLKFDFQYLISDQQFSESDIEIIHSALRKRALELASAELSAGITLVGPQKHDVIFLYNGNDSRFFCSQGQQRSIILAFKMAQIVYHHKVHGFYPVLLLDDVLSELDQGKQSSLISALNEIQTQTFLTTTDVDVLQKLNADNGSIFRVREGRIEAKN